MDKYTGTIVEESLIDNRIINRFKITKVSITKKDDPGERGHLYQIETTEDQIKNLSKSLKPRK